MLLIYMINTFVSNPQLIMLAYSAKVVSVALRQFVNFAAMSW